MPHDVTLIATFAVGFVLAFVFGPLIFHGSKPDMDWSHIPILMWLACVVHSK